LYDPAIDPSLMHGKDGSSSSLEGIPAKPTNDRFALRHDFQRYWSEDQMRDIKR
jgi:hypothetical protein